MGYQDRAGTPGQHPQELPSGRTVGGNVTPVDTGWRNLPPLGPMYLGVYKLADPRRVSDPVSREPWTRFGSPLRRRLETGRGTPGRYDGVDIVPLHCPGTPGPLVLRTPGDRTRVSSKSTGHICLSEVGIGSEPASAGWTVESLDHWTDVPTRD